MSKIHREGWARGGRWVGFGNCCARHRARRKRCADCGGTLDQNEPHETWQCIRRLREQIEAMCEDDKDDDPDDYAPPPSGCDEYGSLE